MARPAGGKVQLIEYPLFDTPFAGVGSSAIGQLINLFGRSNQPQFSNMQQGGQIPSGGVFLISSVRCSAFFKTLANTNYSVAYGAITAETSYGSDASRMADCYDWMAYGSQVTVYINQNPQIVMPWWQFPAGGGTHGSNVVNNGTSLNNGVPSREAICRFLKPLEVAPLQPFTAAVQFYSILRRSTAGDFTGNAYPVATPTTATATTNDFSPLNQLNNADGAKVTLVTLGGHISRDIGG